MDETYDAWAGRDERVFIHLPVERRILRDLPAGARILDLGCGDGSHIGLLATGCRLQGCGQDTARSWIWRLARRHFRGLERWVRVVIRLELTAVRWLRPYPAYGYVVGRTPPVGTEQRVDAGRRGATGSNPGHDH